MNIKIHNDRDTLGPTIQSDNPQVQTVTNEQKSRWRRRDVLSRGRLPRRNGVENVSPRGTKISKSLMRNRICT